MPPWRGVLPGGARETGNTNRFWRGAIHFYGFLIIGTVIYLAMVELR